MATKTKATTRAAAEEEVPKRQSARSMLAMIPRTAVVEEEVPKKAVHTTKADISLNMAMKMKAAKLAGTRSRIT